MDLVEFLVLLAIAGATGVIGNARGHLDVPYGWLGAIAVGFFGGNVGYQLFGGLGPSLADVPLIPAVIGALLFVSLMELVLRTFIRVTML